MGIIGFSPSQDDVMEFRMLMGDEHKRGAAYARRCQQMNSRCLPPSRWLVCPECGYRDPESIELHIALKHQGLRMMCKKLGIEQKSVVTSNYKRSNSVLRAISHRKD